MQTSKRKINQTLERELSKTLFQVLADIKSPKEIELFLQDLLGKGELLVLAKRLAIAHFLDHGRSYQNIKDNVKVSSATIASIDKQRKNPGYQLGLKRAEADRWAEKWTDKIENFLHKI
jgi:uncharacterized protein YerC